MREELTQVFLTNEECLKIMQIASKIYSADPGKDEEHYITWEGIWDKMYDVVDFSDYR